METTRSECEDRRDFLRGRDTPCPSCKYNLRDQGGDRCPECGTLLALRLNVAQPRLASFVAGVIGLSIGAGFHTMVYAWFLAQRFGGNWGPGFLDPEIVSLELGGLGSIVGLVAWIRYWRRLRERGAALRWGLALACAVFSIGTAIAFFGFVD